MGKTPAAVVFLEFPAFVVGSYGSPKTQNLEDAIAHAQGGQPLARAAADQMPAMRQLRGLAHRLPELWVL